ncbi:MAG: hypothetical protein HDT28_03295 [Clostridiales bacterium]|nr:hypothetical protein [Clostridiales bacterium]
MIKKSLKSIAKVLCATIGVCAAVAPLTACNKGDKPLVLATDILDGVFNPFFYTSGSDGDVVGQTQIGMLSSDKTGKLVAGWDEPSVSLAFGYKTTGTQPNGNDYSNYYTDYYFAIKDNIKFSDGTLLTKDDVLFNMYMYLDPAYTGSSTMYSVKIQGLQAYRTQNPNATSSSSSNDSYYNSEATARINMIRDWADTTLFPDNTWNDLANFEYYDDVETIESDIEQVHSLFREELNSDYNNAISLDVKKEYEKYKGKDGELLITEGWEAFLYMYGIISLNAHRDAAGNIDYYERDNSYTGDTTQEALVNYVFAANLGDLDTVKKATSASSIKTYKNNLVNVITYYGTANNFFSYVKASVISHEFQGNMKVFNVDGINVKKMSEIPNENATEIIQLKDENGNAKEYDVLTIRIDGVDPKAVQNFGFSVAPGHYYAGAENWNKRNTDIDAAKASGKESDLFFGVPFADPTFMRTVKENHVPLGAGAYKASTDSFDTDPKTDTDFYHDNNVYFAANEYFLLGEPKIKKLTYKVVSSSTLYDAVNKGEVHYATPSIDADKINALAANKNLHYAESRNLGYGYVGISALYIPDIYIRRAIMTTFNAQDCIDYYGGGTNAEIIRRPMSKTLEYYPTEAEDYYPFDPDGNAAKEWLKKAGTKLKGDKLYTADDKPLKYTFTIAGDTDDHPAAAMLNRSAAILNKIGMEITVTHDSNALIKLAGGQLTVWAAAWSSSSDPDMYQVYHKDSNATSTLAWGYRYLTSAECISNDTKYPKADRQSDILNNLSTLIEEGREYTEFDDRKIKYDQALDTLMSLAVEFPTYQRKVYYVWGADLFDESTMYTSSDDVTPYQSPLNRIWLLEFKG